MYIMTSFNHPGGNYLLSNDYVVFKSIHNSPRYEKIINSYGYKFEKKGLYTFDSSLAQDLLKLDFRGSHIAPSLWWYRFTILNILLFYFEHSFILCPTLMNSLCLGTIYALLGLCIGHDGSHGAVGSKYINEFCSYYMDFIGNTNYSWHSQHILQHHPYTNESCLDPDVTSAEPILFFDKTRGAFKSSHAFVIFLLGPAIVYDFTKITQGTFGSNLRQRFISFVLRAYLLVKIFYFGYFLYGQIVVLTAGAILGFLFQVSHNTVHTKRNLISSSNDWYKNQIETSSTYGGQLAGFITGGLNYQIEHHVFPHMNSCYYPQISSPLSLICKKHDVVYIYYSNYVSNFISYLQQ